MDRGVAEASRASKGGSGALPSTKVQNSCKYSISTKE